MHQYPILKPSDEIGAMTASILLAVTSEYLMEG
jgi:hypothetical protein